MLKIAVFGFYGSDSLSSAPGSADHVSPVDTAGFMRHVWQMEPAESRLGSTSAVPCFVKLSHVASQPVYVQSLSDRMAPGAGLLNCDGYIAIIDAVKILAPRSILNALGRLVPGAHLIIAAGRQNEPEALSSDEIRAALGLHPDLPVYPYVPGEPKTVHRMIKRLARYIEDAQRIAPPLLARGRSSPPGTAPAQPTAQADSAPAPPAPRIHGLDHVAITVSDLDRALDFYRGLLGFRLLGHLDFPGEERDFTIAYLDTGRGVLELFSFEQTETQPTGWLPDDRQAGMRHFALRVTGLDAIVEQLACAGVPFTMPPTDALGGVRIAFFTDPDGTLIELIEGDLVYSRR